MIGGELASDEGAAGALGFDHERGVRQSGHDAIACGKMIRSRAGARRVFRYEAAALGEDAARDMLI